MTNDILQATIKQCRLFQDDAARAYELMRWEFEHGALSRVALQQVRAASLADEAMMRLDRINGHA